MKSVRAGAFGSLLKTGITKVYEFGSKHSHIISAGVGIVSIVATGYFAYKARPKMDAILDEAREKMDALNSKANDISEEEYKKEKRAIVVETAKKATPVLAPAVISGVTGSAANCFSAVQNAKNIKKIAEVSAIASMNELAYSELYSKTKEIVGEEKAAEIQKEVDQSLIDKKYGNDISDEKVDELFEIALQASGGNQLYYDPMFGRLFKSDDDTLISATNHLMGKLERSKNPEKYISYNQFWSEIDLPGITAGEDYAVAWYDQSYTQYAWTDESKTTGLELNLNNTVKIGKRSVTVLHWFDKPVPVEMLKPRMH